ncbi:MAG: type VI secretion system tube protein Hcp [Gemmatimonadales bacterium]|jgi:type VI secretion system secreted protein Hcp
MFSIRPIMLLGAAPLLAGFATVALRTTSCDSETATTPTAIAATFYAWIRIGGIEGEATKRGHERWIQVLGFSWGLAAGQTGGRNAAARPTFHPLTIEKYLDKSSPHLAAASAEGRVIPEAELVFYGPAGTSSPPLGIVRLTNVQVAEVRAERLDAASTERPIEVVGLRFGTIEWQYNEIDPVSRQTRSTAKTGWNAEANRAM